MASSTPTTAGKPYSRAITAPWVIRPPTSVTRPVIATNSGRPARVRVRGDQDVAGFEIGLRHVEDDAGPALDRAGGNRQADQRVGRHIVATVRAGDDLAIGGEHAGRRERLVRRERVLALGG